MINQFTTSALITAVATFLLGLYVLVKGGIKRKLYITFALYSFSIAWWSFCVTKFNPDFQDPALLWGRLLHLGAILIPTLFVHFVLVFLEEKNKFILFLVYSFSALFLALTFFTRLLITGTTYRPAYSYPTPGVLYPIFFVFFVSCILFSLVKLYKALLSATGHRKNQIKYLLLSSLVGYLGGLKNFMLIIGLQIFPIYPYGTYAIPLYTLVVTYTIIKYRLMDISVVITRTGVFIAVYTLILGIPFAVAVYLRDWLVGIFGQHWLMLPLGLMAVLATVGPFIYIYVERRAEARLLREQKRYQDTLKQASVGMTRIRNLRKLLDLVTHIVTKTVKISYAAIYLFNKETNEFVLQVSRDKGRLSLPKLPAENPLISWLMLKRDPVIYEEIKRKSQDAPGYAYSKIEEQMRLLIASVVIPSFLEDRLMGFIVLGDKLSGQIYTPEDLNVFQVLASQAALAIENAQFYEDTKQMQEQIAQAEKMATIGTMADGLSHQINNRFYALSLIAGDTIDTIKLTDAQNCTPEVREMLSSVNYALERIQANVMQGGEVVKGILKYTRKDDAGFEAVTLDQIITATLEMVQYKVKLSEIDLIRNYPADLPRIKVNAIQLQEAFFNFIDNAYDAITERKAELQEPGYKGKITISAKPSPDSTLEITVEDNGLGIKEQDSKKVFTPFFTTKTSSRRGTGLGLYVINRIITDTHKGKINFESKYGTGTRFIIELPLA